MPTFRADADPDPPDCEGYPGCDGHCSLCRCTDCPCRLCEADGRNLDRHADRPETGETRECGNCRRTGPGAPRAIVRPAKPGTRCPDCGLIVTGFDRTGSPVRLEVPPEPEPETDS